MQEGYDAFASNAGNGAPGDEEDPVVAFLFRQAAAEPAPAPAPSSRTIARLENRKSTLYLPTHSRSQTGGMVRRW
jgi:hypothetical protein